MSTRRQLHRSVALLASAGATAALTLVPASGAHAAVAGLYAAAAASNAEFVGSGGGTCDLTSAPGSDDVTSGIRHFSHGTKHASADLKATYTNSLDTADKVTVKGHVDSSMTLKKKHNDLSAFELTVGGSVQINHTITGSQCQGSGEVLGETQVSFTEHKKGVLSLTRDTQKPNSLIELVIENAKTGQAVAFTVFEGSHSHAVSKAVLKPGTYVIAEGFAGIVAGESGIPLKSARLSTKVAQTIDIHGVFAPKKH